MPRPKVTSAVVRLNMLRERPYTTDEKLLFRLIRAAFNMRRKTLVNALDSVCGKEKAKTALAACGFPETVRGETLSLEDYVNLTNTMIQMKQEGLTQKALAERMNCTQQYVSKILKGQENLSLDILSRLEDALGISLIYDSHVVSYPEIEEDLTTNMVAESAP